MHSKCKIIHTDLKPENILMCVSEQHIKALGEEALDWIKNGTKPKSSFGKTNLTDKKFFIIRLKDYFKLVSTAPIRKSSASSQASSTKMSKNKKKKLKKKEKLKALNVCVF